MFKKMLPWLIMILVAITLIVFAAFMLYNYLDKSDSSDPNEAAVNSVDSVKGKKLSASEIKELSLEMNDLITNLSDGSIVKISFNFEFENEEAKEEFGLLDFKVKDAVIDTLADITPEQIQGSKGKDALKSALLNKINSAILSEGKVRQISVTNFVLSS